MKTIKINYNKRIGDVIFIVEGQKDESKLIVDIFHQVFKYNIYKINSKDEFIQLKKTDDKYSRILIIKNKIPQIQGIIKHEDYLDKIFNKISNFGFDPHNSAIYFIFDRDYLSNSQNVIEGLMRKLINSRENPEYYIPGILLLSYPSLESFYCNANNDDSTFSSALEMKKYVNVNKYKNITEENIKIATMKFLEILRQINLIYDENILDDFKEFNKDILIKEDTKYHESGFYLTLSLFIISLLDLQIIELAWLFCEFRKFYILVVDMINILVVLGMHTNK